MHWEFGSHICLEYCYWIHHHRIQKSLLMHIYACNLLQEQESSIIVTVEIDKVARCISSKVGRHRILSCPEQLFQTTGSTERNMELIRSLPLSLHRSSPI